MFRALMYTVLYSRTLSACHQFNPEAFLVIEVNRPATTTIIIPSAGRSTYGDQWFPVGDLAAAMEQFEL